jgi:uncharacterized protein (TIGR03437 family)
VKHFAIMLAATAWVGSAAFAATVNGKPVQIAGWNYYDPALLADGRPALLTRFAVLHGLAIGPDGLMVLAGSNQVRKIGADGIVRTLLTATDLDSYVKLAIDRSGDIYYTAPAGIIKLTPSGATVRVAGMFGTSAPPQEGVQATAAALFVEGIALDPSGNLIFSDGNTMRVWRIDASGALHAVAGTATPGTAGEGGPAVAAQLEFPGALAYDAAGALYISDQHRILKVQPDGTLVRLASSSTAFNGPIAVDSAGVVYYTTSQGYSIARLNADGSSTPVAGTLPGSFSNGCGSGSNPAVGDAKTATFGQIGAMVFDQSGNLLVVDQSNSTVRQINPVGQIRTLAGAPPVFSGDGGPTSAATFSNPQALAFDSAGNLYIADTGNNRIRKVTTDGTINTIGGQGGPTGDMVYSCSGISPNYLNSPAALALDATGTVYVADTLNHRVVKLAADGTPILFAGTGTKGYAMAAAGAAANTVPLDSPRALGIDSAGNIWVGDNAIRILKISPAGVIVNVLPGMRARSFSTDAQQNLYVTSALISYQLMPGDQLLQLFGNALSQLNPSGTPPVELPNDVSDQSQPSGITRDAQGTLYTVGGGVVTMISLACNVIYTTTGTFPSQAWYVAESPQGDVYAVDNTDNVIWRLPHLTTVANDLPTPTFTPGAVVQNAASQLISVYDTYVVTGAFTSAPVRFVVSDSIAPGEIVRINGQCLGPFNTVLASFDTDGRLPTKLGGVSVVIGGIAAPLIAVQAGGIVAVTPFGLTPGQNLPLVVTFSGASITTANGPFYALGLQTVAYRPGLARFVELDGSKTAAAINQDGTINSQTHPAPVGSVVALWATGLGQTSPAGVDGQMQTNTAAKYLANVQVTVGSAPAVVQYAGPAPASAGLSQINIQVPQTKSGAQPVQVLIGTAPFLQNVQLWVQ